MNRNIKRTLIGFIGAAALFGGLAACSHQRFGHGWGGTGNQDNAQMRARVIEKVAGNLDLDATQKAKLVLLADMLQAQRQALRGSGPDMRAEIQSLVGGATFDRTKAKALVDAKVNAVTSGSPEVIAAVADLYDSLKPEQQAKLRELLARRGGGMRRG